LEPAPFLNRFIELVPFLNRFIGTGFIFEPVYSNRFLFGKPVNKKNINRFNKTGSKTEPIPINRFKNATGSNKQVQ
jgi:hypothetical protein